MSDYVEQGYVDEAYFTADLSPDYVEQGYVEDSYFGATTAAQPPGSLVVRERLFQLSQANYLAALKALLPTGAVWPREDSSALARVCQGIATTISRLRGRAGGLISDAFPASTYELLPEWEASLGLPDPCAGDAQTAQQRRNHVVARLGARGGQSRAYYIAWAAALGFEITITEFRPFRAGEAAAGDPVNGEDWLFTWQINAPATTISYFTAGSGSAGEPLAIWGNAVLVCEMGRLAPAHTTLIIAFPPGEGGSTADSTADTADSTASTADAA